MDMRPHDVAQAGAVREVVDVSGAASALQTLADYVQEMTKSIGGLESLIQSMRNFITTAAQAAQKVAASVSGVARSLFDDLRAFFKDQGRARLRGSGSALSDGPGWKDHVNHWSALLARLRRNDRRRARRSPIMVLSAQPNGPNLSIAFSTPAIGLHSPA